jgi:hypothetical protein
MKTLNADVSDLDKLFEALSFLKNIRDFDSILAAVGLDSLPTAQKYGILFGIITFTVTVTTVICLLVLGGSFKRMADQAKTGVASIPDAIEERITRPLLLERLLDAQERLLDKYSQPLLTEKMTPLCEMLLNIAPDVAKAKEVMDNLIVENEVDKKKKDAKLKDFIPEGYEENYVQAYRRCQDKPGGELVELF